MLGSALTVIAAACTPPVAAGPTPVEERDGVARREIVRGGGTTGGLAEYHPTTNHARIIDFRATREALWPRVLSAYDSLGLPIGEVDASRGSVGTSAVRVTARLHGTRLSEYLDCGPGPLGTPAADSYVVILHAATELTPTPASVPTTTMRMLVEGTAKANATQGDPVTCVSTGKLETRLARLVDPASPASPVR